MTKVSPAFVRLDTNAQIRKEKATTGEKYRDPERQYPSK
jgi:hypothetical protein